MLKLALRVAQTSRSALRLNSSHSTYPPSIRKAVVHSGRSGRQLFGYGPEANRPAKTSSGFSIGSESGCAVSIGRASSDGERFNRYWHDPQFREAVDREKARAKLEDQQKGWITYAIHDPTAPDHAGAFNALIIYVGQSKNFTIFDPAPLMLCNIEEDRENYVFVAEAIDFRNFDAWRAEHIDG